MTDPPPLPTAPASSRGRGLVVAGAVLVGIYLVPAAILIAWFLSGLMADVGTMGMVFPFWLMAFLALAPLWIVGIALLGAGRSQQRGPVRGATAAWILTIGGMPAIGVLMVATIALLGVGQDGAGSVGFFALLVGIPVLTVLALLSGVWLIWGKPRTP